MSSLRGPRRAGKGPLNLADAASLGVDGERLRRLLRECQHVALDGGPAWLGEDHLADAYELAGLERGASE